jgi:hypothetical protein
VSIKTDTKHKLKKYFISLVSHKVFYMHCPISKASLIKEKAGRRQWRLNMALWYYAQDLGSRLVNSQISERKATQTQAM